MTIDEVPLEGVLATPVSPLLPTKDDLEGANAEQYAADDITEANANNDVFIVHKAYLVLLRLSKMYGIHTLTLISILTTEKLSKSR